MADADRSQTFKQYMYDADTISDWKVGSPTLNSDLPNQTAFFNNSLILATHNAPVVFERL